MGPPSSQPQQQHRISQSLYDESLLENQDAFDLTPSEAVTETLDQFRTQGVDLSHLATSHPDSPEGQAEREGRREFEGWLDLLDGRVWSDGSVDLEGGGAEDILGALRGIEQRFSGREGGGDGKGGGCEAKDSGDDDGSDGAKSSAEDEDENDDEDDKAEKNIGSTVSESAAMRADGSGGRDGRLAYLTALHQSQSMYTLMSMLGAVALPPSPAADGANPVARPSPEREEILTAACRILTTALTPDPPSGCRQASHAKIVDVKVSLRDSFVAFDRLSGLIRFYSDVARLDVSGEVADDLANEEENSGAMAVLIDVLQLAVATCRACEKNKVSFVHAGTGGGIAATMRALSVASLLRDRRPTSAEMTILTESCRLVTVLCRFDDFRSPSESGGSGGGGMMPAVSSAHDHASEFHRSGAVPELLRVAEIALDEDVVAQGEAGEEKAQRVELVSAVLSAMRVLAVNDEIVQSLIAVGTLDVVRRALRMGAPPPDNTSELSEDGTDQSTAAATDGWMESRRRAVTAGALGLVRNLCGNDEIKTTLCLGTSDATSALPSILEAMRLYRSHPLVQEHGLGTLAAMALRRPANAMRIVESDGPRDILTGMRQHPDRVPVQRQGALAVRNVASRLVSRDGSSGVTGNGAALQSDVDVREAFLDLGAESVLRNIAGKHQGSVDEAYAALRDLGCSISMVKIDAEAVALGVGSIRAEPSRTAMFGDVKPRFNPVFEQSEELGEGGMEGRIARHVAGS